MVDLELRKQVAIASGWKDIRRTFPPYELTLMGKSASDDYYLEVEIPEYDLSVDAIIAEFDKENWEYVLERSIFTDGSIKYWADNVDNSIRLADTPAIALCKLFIAIHNSKEDKE